MENRRFLILLERYLLLCFSSLCFDTQGAKESTGEPSYGAASAALLDDSLLVPETPKTSDRPPSTTAGQTGPAGTTPTPSTTVSAEQKSEAHHLAHFRAILQDRGLPEATTNIILKGWAGETTKSYATYIKKWTVFL
jgi:hypothetical protein